MAFLSYSLSMLKDINSDSRLKIKQEKNRNFMSLIKYKPPFQQYRNLSDSSNIDLASLHNLRSIIVTKDNEIVCLSPPKSLRIEEFVNLIKEEEKKKTTNESFKESVFIEEFVEGTMVNVFFDPTSKEWMMATKSSIGGANKFYHHRMSNVDDFAQWMYQCVLQPQVQINSFPQMNPKVDEFVIGRISDFMQNYFTKKNQAEDEAFENEFHEKMVDMIKEKKEEKDPGDEEDEENEMEKETYEYESVEEDKKEKKDEIKTVSETKTSNSIHKKRKEKNEFRPNEQSFSFFHLFCDCLRFSNLNLNQLDPTRIYSFVMQHPFNRIVVPVSQPKLYLVEAYQKMKENEKENTNETQKFVVLRTSLDHADSQQRFPELSNANIHFPLLYRLANQFSIEEFVESQKTNIQPYTFTGYVFKRLNENNVYVRAKILNPGYLYIHNLRSNNSNSLYKFLELRRQFRQGVIAEVPTGGLSRPVYVSSDIANLNRFDQYYHFFPEDIVLRDNYTDQLLWLCYTLYTWYVQTFIQKTFSLNEHFPPFWKRHLKQIHKTIYLDQLKEKHIRISPSHIEDYFDSLDLPLVCFTVTQFILENHSDYKRRK